MTLSWENDLGYIKSEPQLFIRKAGPYHHEATLRAEGCTEHVSEPKAKSIEHEGSAGAGRSAPLACLPPPSHTCPGRPLALLPLLARSNIRKIQTPLDTEMSDRRASLPAAPSRVCHPLFPHAERWICHRLIRIRDCQGRKEGQGSIPGCTRTTLGGARAPSVPHLGSLFC